MMSAIVASTLWVVSEASREESRKCGWRCVSVQSNRLYHTEQAGKGKKWWRYCFGRGADGSILDLESRAERREVPEVRQRGTGGQGRSCFSLSSVAGAPLSQCV